MDARPPPHAYTRPPERTLIHNPNHPPVHVPFSTDPYPTSSRRDPFLPSAAAPPQTERHNGWGNTVAGHGIHPSHHPSPSAPPPPSMSSSNNPPAQAPYSYHSPRRRSLGGASPPNPYRAPSHDAPPPPPPPSFARTHMPPPSSPQQHQQQQQHHHAQQPQTHGPRPPFAAAYGAGRELPALGAGHRPGSSMSISSLIGGGDGASSTQVPPSHSSPTSVTVHASSGSHSMQPPSPRRGLPSGSRPDYQPFRRQASPDRPAYPNSVSRAPEGHVFTAGSPARSYSNHGSPDQGRQPPTQPPQPYKPMLFQGPRAYVSPPNDAHARDARQPSSTVPQRPNSQPTAAAGTQEQDVKGYDPLGGRRAIYGQPEERRRTVGESHHPRPNAAELLGAPPSTSTDRDRPVTEQPRSHSAYSPPRDRRGPPSTNPPPRGLWRHSAPEEALRDTTEGRRDEPPALYRGYGGHSTPSQTPAMYGAPASEDMVRGRSLDHLSHRVVEQYHAPPTSDPHSNDRQKPEQLSRSLSTGGGAYPGRSSYEHLRRMGEEMQPSKSFLANLGPEAIRRTGRASPLPQAVQGAQAQPMSIGKDPSIKSEFGRMFSGLGSGLGSSTPSRQSPMPPGGSESVPPSVDMHDARLQRVNSQNGRKPKRVKDEEGVFERDSTDGGRTPLAGNRGPKRNKPNHPAHHHHHHHAHPHHHHHHHHRPDDDVVGPQHVTAGSHPSAPQNGAAPHHHHHHHGAAHHHHHAPRPDQQSPLPIPKIPPKIHDIQPVLDEAAKYPRNHLGSYLYEATPELPRPNSSLDDQFCYASKPKPMPRFERNPINCTITVRIPRYYLKPRQRQQIVLQKHLWGARIYRDDSDPIAAAIHSGWIRGEWDDTVDVNMLDPRVTAPNAPSDAEDTLTKIPAAPVTPPADMELRMDLLILPRIQEYVGTVEYGISSRKSSNHDGYSFMVHRLRWVEEGVGSRGQERGAAAMKRRLDASTTLLSLMNGGDNALRAVKGTAKLHA